MGSSSGQALRFASVLIPFALAFSLNGAAQSPDAIRIWKVGSPHRGDTPPADVPISLRQEARRRGLELSVESFPAQGFAAVFREAVTRNAAPDLIVIDNHGIITGITTPLGTFEGIGADPAMRPRLIWATGAFDELLGPQRGWTYMFTLSPNHERVKALAVRTPACARGPSGPGAPPELAEVVTAAATAYLAGDSGRLARYTDPDAIVFQTEQREHGTPKMVHTCGVWNNDKLAFATLNASYEADAKAGHTRITLVLRNTAGDWQVLAAARDPVTNDAFVKDVIGIAGRLASGRASDAFPVSATLLAPEDHTLPRPAQGERFGAFTWRASTSENVVAEIGEFAYLGDARLFVVKPATPGAPSDVSTGKLWTTRSEWTWRVWSISRSGEVAFSETRTFVH